MSAHVLKSPDIPKLSFFSSQINIMFSQRFSQSKFKKIRDHSQNSDPVRGWKKGIKRVESGRRDNGMRWSSENGEVTSTSNREAIARKRRGKKSFQKNNRKIRRINEQTIEFTKGMKKDKRRSERRTISSSSL